MILISAYDSPQFAKNRADLICDGVDDQQEIEGAIGLMPAGGEIQLSEGSFNFSEQFPSAEIPITLSGSGKATKLSFDLQTPGSCIEPWRNWTMRNFELVGNDDTTTYGIRLLSGVYRCLFDRVFISGITNACVRGESGNSQNIFQGMSVRGNPDYGFKMFGVNNKYYACQAIRSSKGGISGFCTHDTGALYSGCGVDHYGDGFRFDNYVSHVSVVYPHIEDCDVDFRMAGSEVEPHHIRVFGGLHGNVVHNPHDKDIVFYE